MTIDMDHLVRLKPPSILFCHPERSVSFANAKVMRSRRTPMLPVAPGPRQGILMVLSKAL